MKTPQKKRRTLRGYRVDRASGTIKTATPAKPFERYSVFVHFGHHGDEHFKSAKHYSEEESDALVIALRKAGINAHRALTYAGPAPYDPIADSVASPDFEDYE